MRKDESLCILSPYPQLFILSAVSQENEWIWGIREDSQFGASQTLHTVPRLKPPTHPCLNTSEHLL